MPSMRFVKPLIYTVVIILCGACVSKEGDYIVPAITTPQHEYNQDIRPDDFYRQLSDAAISLTKDLVTYDPSYFTLDYPNGDVPADKGVCCDVVIRAYRKLGIDLQKEVHEDMSANFAVYPHKWGLKSTDKNIDHRRVPNLMKFFERKKANLPITDNPNDYHYGDVVCWDLGHGLTHIGLVVDRTAKPTNRNLIVHNIGGGQVLEDCLFRFKIIGHYRYQKK